MRSTFPSNASVTSIRRWRGGSRSDPSRVPLISMEMAVSRSLMHTVTPLAMSMCLRVRLWSADGCSSQGTIGASLQAQRGSATTFTLVASTKTRERPRRVSKGTRRCQDIRGSRSCWPGMRRLWRYMRRMRRTSGGQHSVVVGLMRYASRIRGRCNALVVVLCPRCMGPCPD